MRRTYSFTYADWLLLAFISGILEERQQPFCLAAAWSRERSWRKRWDHKGKSRHGGFSLSSGQEPWGCLQAGWQVLRSAASFCLVS